MPKVYIVILNWNGWQDTIACLTSILMNDYLEYEIIVCDNASTDDSEIYLKEWISERQEYPIHYIQTGKNLGFAGGNNVGIHYSLDAGDMEYVWLLNNDTIIEKDALSKLIEKIKTDKTIGICGSKLVYYDDHNKIQGLGGIYNRYFAFSRHILNIDEIEKMDYVIGASMLVSKKFLMDVGLMCEDYFLYYEELDWAIRAKGKYSLGCASESVVYHKEGASIGSDKNITKKSDLADCFLVKNKLKITRKYFKYCLVTVYIGLVIGLFRRILKGERKKAATILKIILGR